MKICLLYSKEASPISVKRGFLRGVFSYVAHGDALFVEKELPLTQAEVLVISAGNLQREIVRPICQEAARMRARGVFIDSKISPDESFVASLAENGLSAFAPFAANFPKNALPVIEAAVSGGSLAEYFEEISSSFPHFAVSIRLSAIELGLPCEKGSDVSLSPQALRRLLSRFEPDVFFSPKLCFKYFMYEPSPESVHLVLFDDAETITQKLRLAKKHGASHAFLVWDEVSDIFDEIFF